MANASVGPIMRYLRGILCQANAADMTDAQLLERFASQRDEAAFEMLLRRHVRLVLSVCRRVLGNGHDADDAFQATFLVLVRKASSISKRQALASWLYQVAYRTALKAKANMRNRAAHEMPEGDLTIVETSQEPCAQVIWRDLEPLLDQELTRLSEKYRAPVVLCYLEGKSYEEAAQQIGCPKGTLSTRLTRARELLRNRLTERGLTLPAGMLGTVLTQQAVGAAAPVALVDSTFKAAMCFAAGNTAATGVVSANAAALTEGVLKAMLVMKLKTTAAVLLAVSVVALAGGALAHHGLAGALAAQPALTAAATIPEVAQQDPDKKEEPARKEKDEPKKDETKKEEPKKEPSPPGSDFDEIIKHALEQVKQALEQVPQDQKFDKTREGLKKHMDKLEALRERMKGLPGRLPNGVPQRGQVGPVGRGVGGGALGEGRLGVSASRVDDVLADQLKLAKGQGVVLDEVKADSPAAKAGLKAGDILLELNGKPVLSNPGAFIGIVQDIKANTPVDAVVLRKGQRETIKGLSLPEAKLDEFIIPMIGGKK